MFTSARSAYWSSALVAVAVSVLEPGRPGTVSWESGMVQVTVAVTLAACPSGALKELVSMLTVRLVQLRSSWRRAAVAAARPRAWAVSASAACEAARAAELAALSTLESKMPARPYAASSPRKGSRNVTQMTVSRV